MVTMPITPGIAAAAAVSMPRISAWAKGERRNQACAWFGAETSSV